MKIKIILIALSALFTTISFAQNYNYVPKDHSNKWIDGKEWCIVTKNNVTVKISVEKDKSTYSIVRLLVKNSSDKDVNIFPTNFYYYAKSIEESAITTVFVESEADINKEEELLAERLNVLNNKQYALSNDKVIKNSKLISIIGYVYDIKSSSVARVIKRKDEFKSTLLFNNTVEPGIVLERIAVFNSSPSAGELEFHILISGEDFVFNFEKEFVKSK